MAGHELRFDEFDGMATMIRKVKGVSDTELSTVSQSHRWNNESSLMKTTLVQGPGAPQRRSETPTHPACRTSAVDAAIALRDQLLAEETWYRSEEVGARLRGASGESNRTFDLAAACVAGELFGVRFRGEMQYPAFQFMPTSDAPFLALREILVCLPLDDSGWTAAFWFFQPNGRLGGKRPADVLHRDSAAVLATAQKDFMGDEGI